ncbi:hypothetical protein [Vibrio sp. F74]|uniref:hypothetical protein n=1 Tax=Vibrio sp. F74 TaxID=700020 RepID=UPI0035F572C2
MAGGVSIGTGIANTIGDVLDRGNINETSTAGTLNSVLIKEGEKQLLEALPSKYEVPVRAVTTVYSSVTGMMFNEANRNSGWPKEQHQVELESNRGCTKE